MDTRELNACKTLSTAVPLVDDALRKQHTFLPKGQVLDEAYITTLPADQQEICNSLNRRTEFRVLKTTYNLY